MSSETLLHWMTLYPEKLLSEQVVNRACINIRKSQGNDFGNADINTKKEDATADIRREILNPLLYYGHVEYANYKCTSYSVTAPTLLTVNNSHSILCGARTETLVNEWNARYQTVNEDNGLVTCWGNTGTINSFPFLKREHVSVDEIIRKLPTFSPDNFGTVCESPFVEKLKRFNPVFSKWEHLNSSKTGVYRELDNLPPSVKPWYWIENHATGLKYWQLNTEETTYAALCYSSAIEKKVRINYSKKDELLKVSLPKYVFLPLMIRRPLIWLNVNGGNRMLNSIFQNVTHNTAQEIARIMNTSLQG